MNQQELFGLVLKNALNVQIFQPSEKEVELIEIGFAGIFKKNGKGFLKNPPSWTGYILKDGSVDINLREKCLQAAFGRMLYYHWGRLDAYLGTIINATQNLESMAEAYGLTPNIIPAGLWKLDWQSEEYKKWTIPKEENRKIAKKFADYCDTFCQVFVYIVKNGKTSSIPGEAWRKAMS